MLSVGLFVGWTLFVWLGRIRNAMNDPALADGGRVGPVLLALSFVVPALVLGVLAVLARPGAGWDDHGTRSRLRAGVLVLAAWTTVVWMVRMADIAFGGDHPAGFIAVHCVLGVLSIGLAILAVRAAGGPVPRSRPAPASADGPKRQGS
jgi:hypothetical protein